MGEPPGRGNGRLNHGTGRDSQGPNPCAIELGNEPPLSVDGGLRKDFDRRRVSVRWLSGTILTGLCGAALMGGAVFAALDGEAHFAANPERIEPVRGALGGRATARKSDRLPPIAETNSARHIIRVTTMTKIGEREVPRVRPFVKISSNLALSATELSAKIPPFNPQRLLANMGDDETPAAEEGAGASPDAEVSFVTRDLLSAMPRLKLAALVQFDDVLSKVRDAANYTGTVPPKFALASINPGKLAYASPDAPVDPYAGFEARIVPENITMLAKTAPQATGGNSWNERSIVMKKGETLGAILRDLGATPDEIKAIAAVLGPRGRDGNLKEGQKIRVLLSPVRGTQRLQPVRVTLVGETAIEAVVALSDLGKYVAVDVQSAETQVAEADDDEEDDGTGMRLYQSIYETALRNQVPNSVIEELIRVYSYDVDFQRKARPGDSFEVLYTGDEENNDGKADVMFASLTVGGEARKFYRFITHRRRHRRLLRRDRQEREEVPGAQTGAHRHHALRLRVAAPSHLRLHQDAHRHRLGGADGDAHLCVRQWCDREGRLGIRLRQIHPHQAHQRLRDRLWPHDRLRPRHGAGRAGPPGPGDRLCRLDRPVDRRPCALRNPGQWPLRRSHAHQAAARAGARGSRCSAASRRSATASTA